MDIASGTHAGDEYDDDDDDDKTGPLNRYGTHQFTYWSAHKIRAHLSQAFTAAVWLPAVWAHDLYRSKFDQLYVEFDIIILRRLKTDLLYRYPSCYPSCTSKRSKRLESSLAFTNFYVNQSPNNSEFYAPHVFACFGGLIKRIFCLFLPL